MLIYMDHVIIKKVRQTFPEICMSFLAEKCSARPRSRQCKSTEAKKNDEKHRKSTDCYVIIGNHTVLNTNDSNLHEISVHNIC